MSPKQEPSVMSGTIRSEYPVGTVPPRLKSPLDSMKHKNGGITLDRAVELNGNKFFACNTNILTGGAAT